MCYACFARMVGPLIVRMFKGVLADNVKLYLLELECPRVLSQTKPPPVYREKVSIANRTRPTQLPYSALSANSVK